MRVHCVVERANLHLTICENIADPPNDAGYCSTLKAQSIAPQPVSVGAGDLGLQGRNLGYMSSSAGKVPDDVAAVEEGQLALAANMVGAVAVEERLAEGCNHCIGTVVEVWAGAFAPATVQTGNWNRLVAAADKVAGVTQVDCGYCCSRLSWALEYHSSWESEAHL